MSVTRHYFISNDLDELVEFERELEAKSIDTNQIHVLSNDDTAAENLEELNSVTSFSKRDVIRSGELGLTVGLVAAIAILAGAYFAGLTQSVLGWLPYVVLAILVLGFCTWEGGFIGIQRRNRRFEQFSAALEAGRHIVFVDLLDEQTDILNQIVRDHPDLEAAGTASGTPHWIMVGQKRIPYFLRETMP